MIKSLITPPAGSSTGSWVDCFGTKRVATRFRDDFSGKKMSEFKQNIYHTEPYREFDQAAKVIEERYFCLERLGIYTVRLFWYQNTWLLKPKCYCLNHFKTNGYSLVGSLLFILLKTDLVLPGRTKFNAPH